MIDGILAEWFARQPEAIRAIYNTDAVAHNAIKIINIQMTALYEALMAEGLHVYYCRRIVNRMLYGHPEPEGVKGFGERLKLLDDATVTFSGQMNPEHATKLIGELAKLGITGQDVIDGAQIENWTQ